VILGILAFVAPVFADETTIFSCDFTDEATTVATGLEIATGASMYGEMDSGESVILFLLPTDFTIHIVDAKPGQYTLYSGIGGNNSSVTFLHNGEEGYFPPLTPEQNEPPITSFTTSFVVNKTTDLDLVIRFDSEYGGMMYVDFVRIGYEKHKKHYNIPHRKGPKAPQDYDIAEPQITILTDSNEEGDEWSVIRLDWDLLSPDSEEVYLPTKNVVKEWIIECRLRTHFGKNLPWNHRTPRGFFYLKTTKLRGTKKTPQFAEFLWEDLVDAYCRKYEVYPISLNYMSEMVFRISSTKAPRAGVLSPWTADKYSFGNIGYNGAN